MARRTTARRRSASNFAQAAPPKFVQAKLRLGGRGDAAEQEADRLAARAVRGEAPVDAGRLEQPDSSGLPLSEQAEQSVRRANAGGSHRLSQAERGFYESRMGYDFSKVRIHHSSEANQAAKSIGARAFTIGNNIYFASGEYNANSKNGRHLMAHELTHTIQQNRVATAAPQASPFVQRQPVVEDEKAEEGSEAHPIIREGLPLLFSRIGGKLLRHYLAGSGEDLILTPGDVRRLSPIIRDVNLTEEYVAIMDPLVEEQRRTGQTAVRKIKAQRPGYARSPNTLGQFTVEFRGDLSFDGLHFTFVGERRIRDYYNFDPNSAKNRSISGHIKTYIGSTFPGRPYVVLSAWESYRHSTDPADVSNQEPERPKLDVEEARKRVPIK